MIQSLIDENVRQVQQVWPRAETKLTSKTPPKVRSSPTIGRITPTDACCLAKQRRNWGRGRTGGFDTAVKSTRIWRNQRCQPGHMNGRSIWEPVPLFGESRPRGENRSWASTAQVASGPALFPCSDSSALS